MRAMREVADVHKLWVLDDHGPRIAGMPVGCYYLGHRRSFDFERATAALIGEVSHQLAIERPHTICFGSSKGGTAALWFALRHGYGHAIAGGPQIRLGTYLLHEHPPPYDDMAAYIAGSRRPEAREWLDGLFPQAVAAAARTWRPLDLRVHVGRGDPHWARHVEPFVELMREAGLPLVLDFADYDQHGELGTHFPTFLQDSIRAIIAGD